MITVWPGRDVNELSSAQHVNSVPFTLRYDARLARVQFNEYVWIRFPGNLDSSRNHVEYFIAVRVDLTPVWCITLDRDDPHGHAIDSDRRARPLGSGGYGEVTVNVEQVTRNIDPIDLVHRSILPPGFLTSHFKRANRLAVSANHA